MHNRHAAVMASCKTPFSAARTGCVIPKHPLCAGSPHVLAVLPPVGACVISNPSAAPSTSARLTCRDPDHDLGVHTVCSGAISPTRWGRALSSRWMPHRWGGRAPRTRPWSSTTSRAMSTWVKPVRSHPRRCQPAADLCALHHIIQQICYQQGQHAWRRDGSISSGVFMQNHSPRIEALQNGASLSSTCSRLP